MQKERRRQGCTMTEGKCIHTALQCKKMYNNFGYFKLHLEGKKDEGEIYEVSL